jgi:hypothetical protein
MTYRINFTYYKGKLEVSLFRFSACISRFLIEDCSDFVDSERCKAISNRLTETFGFKTNGRGIFSDKKATFKSIDKVAGLTGVEHIVDFSNLNRPYWDCLRNNQIAGKIKIHFELFLKSTRQEGRAEIGGPVHRLIDLQGNVLHTAGTGDEKIAIRTLTGWARNLDYVLPDSENDKKGNCLIETTEWSLND